MSDVVGRFAPTPSGPLHLGSLVTALGSWLSARAANGRWHVRIDDLDRPRIQTGAEATILDQLRAHGLHWDGEVRRQSEHVHAYQDALESLRAHELVYACTCSRAQLAGSVAPAEGRERIYRGTCRARALTEAGAALRVRVPARGLEFVDATRGLLQCRLDEHVGDFIVCRRDGQIAYQLACVVDEAAQGITEVVRGADLIDSTFRQLYLTDMLGLPRPRYRHLPLIVGSDGRKLSKQNEAQPLDPARPVNNLAFALEALGQTVPQGRDAAELLRRALSGWTPERIGREPVNSP